MADVESISGKIRSDDHERAGELTEKFGSNRLEVYTAWRLAFDKLNEKRQREAFNEARKLHPLPYPRTGRGNRKLVPAA